mmetsp:Transcript_18052/g.59070  ORF Transcript_18052/g.59070 Transcript_18052/m.59070 type:complete len:223 (-) Transcript_18052:263-931(-)
MPSTPPHARPSPARHGARCRGPRWRRRRSEPRMPRRSEVPRGQRAPPLGQTSSQRCCCPPVACQPCLASAGREAPAPPGRRASDAPPRTGRGSRRRWRPRPQRWALLEHAPCGTGPWLRSGPERELQCRPRRRGRSRRRTYWSAAPHRRVATPRGRGRRRPDCCSTRPQRIPPASACRSSDRRARPLPRWPRRESPSASSRDPCAWRTGTLPPPARTARLRR